MAWISTHFYGKKYLYTLVFALLSFSFSFSQTIFQSTDAPAQPRLNDGMPLEVGVKFRATQNGFIKGIRYYKGAGTTGTHIGQLWSADGTLLVSANFINETASGWQEVLFSTPYAISANITYVGATFSSSGDYAVTNSYFTSPVINGALRGLGNGEDGANGLFIFSQVPMFPTNGFQANNYWVDVVFEASNAPDTDPPVVTSVNPFNGAVNITTSSTIKAVFNELLNVSTINNSTFELRDASNALVAATVTYTSSNNTAVLTPSSSLAGSAVYTATIKAGVKDAAGNALEDDYTWSFTTADPPFISPAEGYGGPVLVVSSAGNPFSRYAVEILRAEGLNEFSAKDISAVTASDLANYDVVVLGEMTVNAAQVTMFTNWVNAGGTLIAFKPNALLAPLMGLSAPAGTLSNKYLLVNTASGPGAGIVNQTMQFHGDANLHTLNGATNIATLYSDATTATVNPAVTTKNVGANGGKAIAFTYDLATSIIYTRQGNPLWAGQKRDGQAGPVRSDDMFFPDWVDFNKIAIPQADEQQRLLANIILQSNLHRKPLPRFWYLPRNLKAAVVMTGDDHAVNGTTARFNKYLDLGPNTTEDVANWYAVRATSYIYPNTPISNAQAVAYEAQGFELALHPSTNCNNFTAASLENDFASQLAVFSSAFPGISKPVSNRTHCMPWSDWSSHAKVEFNHGMRLDVNYYYWPGAWIQNRPGMFTGSGMPMRFADLNGALIDCYQATTQMTDESDINVGAFCDAVLDKAIGAEGYYGTFVANMHTDQANHAGSDAIVASALSRKIPVISAKQLLRWVDGRNNSSFSNMVWNNSQLDFTVTAPSGAINLNCMLPLNSEDGQLTALKRDGEDIAFSLELIKGIHYVIFDIPVGVSAYTAQYSSEVAVTTHPVSQTICTGNNVTFTSTAAGSPAPTVQWEVSANGTNWANVAGATNSTLTFTPTTADNNKQYRAAWTNNMGTIYSDAAVLTINQTPSLTSTLITTASTGTAFTYTPTSSVSGTSFSWSRAAVAGISNVAAMGAGNINETLVNTTSAAIPVVYVYKLSANGCFKQQNVTVVVNPATGCHMTTSVTANFNGTSISGGRYIWFNSLFKPRARGNGTANFNVTNAKITYTLNNQQVVLSVPNAHIRFAANISTAGTRFINGVWETEVPLNYTGNVFLDGLSYQVPSTIPGGRTVTWSMDIESDVEDVIVDWKWTAGVYTNFSGNAGLTVKPIDGILNILNPLLNVGSAGTPTNYYLNVVAGAMGAGLLNITSTYSSTATVACMANSITTSGRSVITSSDQTVETNTQSSQKASTNQGLDVSVMPNPATGYFNISINGNDENTVNLRVLDISGRVIEIRENLRPAGVLKVGANWGAGTYFVELKQGDQRKVLKVIKIN